MALFWGVVAVGAFVLDWHEPGLTFLRLGRTGPNIGWLALLFGAYNLVRWLAGRMAAQRRKMQEEKADQRYRPRRSHAPDAEPDPAFDFRDRPPDDAIRPGP
jgi:hypothetical protein